MGVFPPLHIPPARNFSNAMTIHELLGPDDGPHLLFAEAWMREAVPLSIWRGGPDV